MIKEILNLLEPNLNNAASLLTLMPSMTEGEQEETNKYIEEVVSNTSLLDLKEKELLTYLKLYLKTRKAPGVHLEELINDTQRQRLEGL